MSKEKALVVDKNEVLEIDAIYKVYSYQGSIEYEYKSEDIGSISLIYPNKEKLGNNYILSDGNKYHESELILGVENIREHNINKII